MDHNIHHRGLTPYSHNKPEQLNEMAAGFVKPGLGLAARAGRLKSPGRLAPKVKTAAPKRVEPGRRAGLPGPTRPSPSIARTKYNRNPNKQPTRVGKPTGMKDLLHRAKPGDPQPKFDKYKPKPSGASDPRHRTTAGRAEIRREGEARLAKATAKGRENKQRARAAASSARKPGRRELTASDIRTKGAIQSSERQNQRAREALGSGKVDFEKRLSNVKPGQTKASDWKKPDGSVDGKSKYARRRAGGESHADIMAKSKTKTQSMRDELAQIKGRIADKDKASAVRGARREGGLRTRITPEQQANRDRDSQRVTGRAGGESYADFRKRTFGSSTSPKVTANPTKPGDRASVLRGKSAAEKASVLRGKSAAEKASVLAQARRAGGLRTR